MNEKKGPTQTNPTTTSPKAPIDASVTDTISGFRRELGAALFEDVLLLVAGVRSPLDIPNQLKQQLVLSSIERCRRGLQRIREIASELPETEPDPPVTGRTLLSLAYTCAVSA